MSRSAGETNRVVESSGVAAKASSVALAKSVLETHKMGLLMIVVPLLISSHSFHYTKGESLA